VYNNREVCELEIVWRAGLYRTGSLVPNIHPGDVNMPGKYEGMGHEKARQSGLPGYQNVRVKR